MAKLWTYFDHSGGPREDGVFFEELFALEDMAVAAIRSLILRYQTNELLPSEDLGELEGSSIRALAHLPLRPPYGVLYAALPGPGNLFIALCPVVYLEGKVAPSERSLAEQRFDRAREGWYGVRGK
ncbi:hypothetical protein ACH4T9_00965 [Micromonospora sp. NPDC020750]|uniref:hypothetical protein n=1 Tax=unclassified Micromonospora TaxID=2617518 RepID=UPI0037A8FB52